MKVYYFENDNTSIRSNSSAGGLFSALAELTINNGGAVYGACFDKDWSVVHSRAVRVEDICRLRGSKYVFTNIKSCLGQIDDDLKAGRRVMFCGTPCQVAAIRKKSGENKDLLLVEVVCHGAPQPKYWNLYLNELLQKQGKSRSDISSINFRDKTEGWKNYAVRIDFKNGSSFIQSHRVNPYILAFIYDYSLRTGCSKCPFKYPNSKADISMGDFWGIEALAPEFDNNLGTTIAIANTPKGEEILANIASPTTFTIEDVAKYNPAIVKAPNAPSDMSDFEEMATTIGFYQATTKFLKPVFDKRSHKMSFRYRMSTMLYRAYAVMKKCLQSKN